MGEEVKPDLEKAAKRKKKKRISRITTIALVVILVAGLGIMLYPSFSDWWNSLHASQAIASYMDAVDLMDNTEISDILSRAREYNSRRPNGIHFDLTDEEYAEYESLLDISGTGIMGYISIPSINVSLPIYHGTDEAVLQIATGHLAGSSLPVGGNSTHAVISGHRGLPSAKLFTDLDELVVGDSFSITVLTETFTYRVDQIAVVTPDDVSELAITNGKDYCTLVTCTPYGVNSHRMLVRGHRIANEKEELNIIITPDASKVPTSIVAVIIILPTFIIMMIVYIVYSSLQKKSVSATEILEELKK